MVLCDQKKPKNLEVNVVREQHLILKNPKSKVKLNIVIGTKLINWLKHQQHQYKVFIFIFQADNIASITADISNMDTTLVSFKKHNYMTLDNFN